MGFSHPQVVRAIRKKTNECWCCLGERRLAGNLDLFLGRWTGGSDPSLRPFSDECILVPLCNRARGPATSDDALERAIATEHVDQIRFAQTCKEPVALGNPGRFSAERGGRQPVLRHVEVHVWMLAE